MWNLLLKFAVVLALAPLLWAGLTAKTADRDIDHSEVKMDFTPVKPTYVTPTTRDNKNASSYTIRKSHDGHFRTEGIVDGAYVDFLIDTGASVIALTPEDARKAGYTQYKLDYSHSVNTANGSTSAAVITLERVSLGGITLRDVRAVVIKDGLNQSLLGMSFLGRLQRVEARPDVMTLQL